jgi:DNA-binding protein YbaB
LNNEAKRDQLTDVLALVQEQMTDIAALRKKQAALTVSASVADGMVEVTVNAHGQLVKTIIDESYLDDYEFEELGDHITEAAQMAARDAGRRVVQMMAPISERRKAFPALSDIVEGAPDLRELTPPGADPFAGPGRAQTPDDNEGGHESAFATVRR